METPTRRRQTRFARFVPRALRRTQPTDARDVEQSFLAALERRDPSTDRIVDRLLAALEGGAATRTGAR